MSICSEYHDAHYLQLCRLLEARQPDPVALDALCSEYGLSVYTLNRLFKKWLGQSPRSWQRRLRLNEAAILLGRTDQSVLSIAQAVGYDSQQSFCRAFGREWSANPTQFRQQFWAQHGRPHTQAVRLPVSHRVLPTLRLLSQRFVGDYDQVPRYWQVFGAMAERAGFDARQGVFVGVTWDDPDVTPLGEIRYDCAFLPLNQPASTLPRAQTEVTIQTVFGGAYAALAKQGRYQDAVPEGYQSLVCHWLPSSGWRLDMRPAIEWFEHAPWQMPEDDWRFEIRLPIV